MSETENNTQGQELRIGRTSKGLFFYILLGLGIFLIVLGLSHLGFSCLASAVDSSCVFFILSQNDGTLQDTIDEFHFFDWKKPNSNIRPFVSDDLNLKDSKILKYRVGFLPHWIAFRIYYEAQYLSPDGSKFTGPALGSLPFTTPNIIVSALLLVSGVVLVLRQLKRKKRHKAKLIIKNNK